MNESQNPTSDAGNILLQQFLDKVAMFSESEYGRLVRDQFQSIDGASELAMLAAPTAQELEQLRRAVAIMTPSEKQDAHKLTDEQIERIAADAKIDPANFAIFMNAYAISCKNTP